VDYVPPQYFEKKLYFYVQKTENAMSEVKRKGSRSIKEIPADITTAQ
jgi:hypothetical protein